PDRFVRIRLRRPEHGGARVRRHASAIAAEQAMQREPGDLAAEIPERDVDGADRPERGRAVALPQRLPEPFAIERVLADHERLQVLDEALGIEAGGPHRGTEERMPLEVAVRLQRHEPEVALAAEPSRVAAVRRRRDIGPSEQGDGEIRDLHGRPTMYYSGAPTRRGPR